MSQTLNAATAVVGIDIGKNSFHIVGHDERGAIVLRQKWSRGQVEARFANMPPCLIGMEACVGAHHLSRRLRLLGHDARLMPAKYVRPYPKGQKNDFRDAEAIAVGAAQAALRDAPQTRGLAHEARRRTRQVAGGLAPGRYRACCAGRRVRLRAQSPEAPRSAPTRGTLPAAYQSVWARPGPLVAVLHPVGRDRGGLQESQGRPRPAPHLPPARATHRSTHLHRVHCLLPPRYAACPAQTAGWRPDAPGGPRQAGSRANARRPLPDHRRPYPDSEPLHRAPCRSKAAHKPTPPHLAPAAPAAHHCRWPTRQHAWQNVVETFWPKSPIYRPFGSLY